MEDTVLMEVSTLTVDPITSLPVVLLTPHPDDPGADGKGITAIAISVGLCEASAIATELDGIEFERPSTHQLMGWLLQDAGVHIHCVEVYDAVGTSYQVRIHLTLADGTPAVRDARPSDAIALALHVGAEIRVSETVIAKAAAAEARIEQAMGFGGSWSMDNDLPVDIGQASGDNSWFLAEPTWPGSYPPGSPDLVLTRQRLMLPDGDFIEGDLSDVSDEAFGKWKM